MDTLRQRWAAGQPTFGGWLSVASSVTAETTARVGFDYICIDNQHGLVDYPATVGMIQAVLLGGSRPIVRVAGNDPASIGKMLDAGAEGIIVPLVNSAADAEAVVRSVRYPPVGARSHGPTLAGPRVAEYAHHANERLSAIPMIETVEALANLDDILAVPGVDAVYVGPADLSLSLGLAPGNNDDRSEFTDALHAIVAACRRNGVVPGVHASGELVERRLEQGFMMVTVAADLVAMRTKMTEDLARARGVAPDRGSASPY